MAKRPSKNFRFMFFWVPAAAYMALIWYLSSRPRPPIPEFLLLPFDPQRFILHFIEFAILGILLARLAFVETKLRGIRLLLVAVAFTFGYAITDEIHQMFVPGRGADLGDLVFGGLGGLVGAAFYSRIWYKIETKALRFLKILT